MPDAPPENDNPATAEGIFTRFGVASAVVAVVAVVAVALGVMIFSAHRTELAERHYQTRVLQTAAEWVDILINMNADTVEGSLRKLHEGTVGELSNDFDSAVAPYRDLVKRLQAHTTGQIESVSIESLYHPPPGPNGTPAKRVQPELTGLVSRIDTVLVVATSVSQNASNDEPQTVRWTLRVDVSDVDGRLMISRLEPIR